MFARSQHNLCTFNGHFRYKLPVTGNTLVNHLNSICQQQTSYLYRVCW